MLMNTTFLEDSFLIKWQSREGVPVKERYFDRDAGEVSHEYQVDLTTENGQLCFGDTLEFLEQVL